MVDYEESRIEDLTQFAKDAISRTGDVALRYYGKGDPELRFDESLVTEAELHLANFFRSRLQATFPEHRLYGDAEMEKDYVHGQKGYMWVFDAPCGVANFQAGIPIWGVSLALLENHWPIFGAFYMPATGDLFYAEAGKKAYWGREEIHVAGSGEISNESLLLTYSRFQGRYRSSFPGKIRNMGCNASHICYVARGRAEAALIANVSYPDLAAAKIILDAAGGEIRCLDGRELNFSDYLEGQKIDEHLIAAPKGAHKSISMYLQEIL